MAAELRKFGSIKLKDVQPTTRYASSLVGSVLAAACHASPARRMCAIVSRRHICQPRLLCGLQRLPGRVLVLWKHPPVTLCSTGAHNNDVCLTDLRARRLVELQAGLQGARGAFDAGHCSRCAFCVLSLAYASSWLQVQGSRLADAPVGGRALADQPGTPHSSTIALRYLNC